MSSASSPIDTTVDIVTPENIAFHYRVAGPFRRFPAYLIDVCIRIAMLFGLAIVASLLSLGLGAASLAVWILAEFTLSWFYGGLFETYWNGQTPGKRILGIRVLTAQGRPVNGYQAVLRNIMRTVDMGPLISAELFGGPAVPLIPTYALGLVVMATNRRFQRLGDIVCRTMVVVEDRPWLSGVAKIEDPRRLRVGIAPACRSAGQPEHGEGVGALCGAAEVLFAATPPGSCQASGPAPAAAVWLARQYELRPAAVCDVLPAVHRRSRRRRIACGAARAAVAQKVGGS